MAKRSGWFPSGIFNTNGPKSPWGGGSGGGDDGASGNNGNGGGGGSRNPWSYPPESRRPKGGGATTLDELLKRARRSGGGGLPTGPVTARLWWMIAGGVLLLWIAFTSFHAIGPRERGVVTFLGSYSGTLEPGIRMTMPAPLAQVQTIDVANIRTEGFPASGNENLMLTRDQNIVDLAYTVRWDIRSAPDFAFQIADPQATVRSAAEAAMRAVVATATLDETIGAGRTRIEAEVQILMQRILDEYRSGIRIQGVAIQKASPPAAVDEEFKQVSAAQQQAQGALNEARAYAQQVLAAAQGEAAEFDKIYEQYRLAPEVTRRRLYYETMEAVLSRTDKTIVEAPGVNSYLPLPALRRAPEAAPEPAPKGATR